MLVVRVGGKLPQHVFDAIEAPAAMPPSRFELGACPPFRSTEVVGEQQGVKPESGKKMLRFLRTDYEGMPKPKGSKISDIFRLIDMRSYRSEFADGGAVVQLSAGFNSFEFPDGERYCRKVSLGPQLRD